MCWGDNSHHQLGDGTNTQRTSAVAVAGLRDVESVDLGNEHGCALTQSHNILCWGANDDGQLGDGTTTERGNPMPVP